jgi:hypothetical protein
VHSLDRGTFTEDFRSYFTERLGTDATILWEQNGKHTIEERSQSWLTVIRRIIGRSAEENDLRDHELLIEYDGAVSCRIALHLRSESLPPVVKAAFVSWLANGPDAEFMAITEPDHQGLLGHALHIDDVSKDFVLQRIPKVGAVRDALDRRST